MHALRRAAAVLVIAGATLVPTSRGAQADPTDCEVIDQDTGECVITVPSPPGDPGTGDPEPPGDGGPAPACVYGGRPMPCASVEGQWSNALQCYLQRMEPQPSASDPVWGGHEPGDGATYWCVIPGADTGRPVWLANPPGGPAGPTPVEVAQMAIESMRLQAIDVGIVPEPGPDSMGIVGMPTWMWVDNPTASRFGPITRSASAGGITVTATGEVETIVWVMGDGATVVCAATNAKGTPYADRHGTQDSPTCGHRYEKTSWTQPGHTFTVTAQSYWRIDWAGAGQSGTIRLDPLQQTVELRVGEAQVLTH